MFQIWIESDNILVSNLIWQKYGLKNKIIKSLTKIHHYE